MTQKMVQNYILEEAMTQQMVRNNTLLEGIFRQQDPFLASLDLLDAWT